jgi:hypothetical protein
MTSPHENLFTESISDRTRGSGRRQVGNTLSGPGVPPALITTQPNPRFEEQTIPLEPTGEPALGTTEGTNMLRDEPGANPNETGQFDNDLIESLEEVIENYRNENIESFRAIVNITRLIFNHPTASREEKEQAFDEYASTISAIGQLQDEAAK